MAIEIRRWLKPGDRVLNYWKNVKGTVVGTCINPKYTWVLWDSVSNKRAEITSYLVRVEKSSINNEEELAMIDSLLELYGKSNDI